MGEPLDERYFKWLYSQVAFINARDSSSTFWALLRLLFTTEFVWLVANDDNRVEDGRDLRHEFVEEERIYSPDPEWMSIGCSVLELLIGLARRLSFESDGDERVADWFWHLLDNLDLGSFNDSYFQTARQQVYAEQAIEEFVWRTYRYNGAGGIFPLREPKQDQRDVELWYQLSSYLMEGNTP